MSRLRAFIRRAVEDRIKRNQRDRLENTSVYQLDAVAFELNGDSHFLAGITATDIALSTSHMERDQRTGLGGRSSGQIPAAGRARTMPVALQFEA